MYPQLIKTQSFQPLANRLVRPPYWILFFLKIPLAIQDDHICAWADNLQRGLKNSYISQETQFILMEEISDLKRTKKLTTKQIPVICATVLLVGTTTLFFIFM